LYCITYQNALFSGISRSNKPADKLEVDNNYFLASVEVTNQQKSWKGIIKAVANERGCHQS
jgi:hypothetical protein